MSNVCHATERTGLHGIMKDEGFKGDFKDKYLWWSLSLQNVKKPFLKKFGTSPAFQTESRYGNFCFNFTLTELLNAYSKQFCNFTSPILRVLGTTLYQKEIVYSVLVHPKYMKHYMKYPRLPTENTYLCGYSEKKMFWHCQSPSDKYKYSLEMNRETGERYPLPLRGLEYFVWDNVAVAFHMKKNWVLKFNHGRLFEHLSVCDTAYPALLKEKQMSVQEANEEVNKLRTFYNVK